MESVEYESAWTFGAMCGNSDINSAGKMIDMCNDYGMDTIDCGDTMAMYMEASQKDYTNGDGKLAWGDVPAMVETVRKIAFREGVGNILADGCRSGGQALRPSGNRDDGQRPGYPRL